MTVKPDPKKIRWPITLETDNLMNQSEHEERTGKRVGASHQLVLEKENSLGNHIRHRQLNEPITTGRKRGKTSVNKSQLVLKSEMRWGSHLTHIT